jgi:hypothetical protein
MFWRISAQVHDITEQEVIEDFSHGIMAKWQFQDFCKENPRNNEEFRRAIKKMIMAEEKTKERFSDRNNQENNRDNSDQRNFPNVGHSDRKRGPDNTIAIADKTKKFSRFRRFEDIENMHCIWHPQGNHITGDCRIFIDRYARKGKKTKISKRITERKTKTTQKTKDSSSQREWSL